MKLRILTLNLHCLVEENLEKKQKMIAEAIIENKIDIVFLQEVAQTKSKEKLVEDNYALCLQTLLEEMGSRYNLYYESIKESFGIYDEGLAFLSKPSLEFVAFPYISKTRDYGNWKSRRILVYSLNSEKTITLATTHFGWSDGYEKFEDQFDLAETILQNHENVILAGDFNIVPGSAEYKYIIRKNWRDIFEDDDENLYPTFRGDDTTLTKSVRIDYVMTRPVFEVLERKVLFKDDRVSDHFGVLIEIVI